MEIHVRGDVKEAAKPGMPVSLAPAVLKWEDPPHSRKANNSGGRRPDSAWNGVAEQLSAERGRWAVVFRGTRREALTVRCIVTEGRRVCFRPIGDFEACVRSWDGVHTVYARYMGEDFS